MRATRPGHASGKAVSQYGDRICACGVKVSIYSPDPRCNLCMKDSTRAERIQAERENMEPESMSIKEATLQLDATPAQVREWADEGKLEVVKRGRGPWGLKLLAESVMAFKGLHVVDDEPELDRRVAGLLSQNERDDRGYRIHSVIESQLTGHGGTIWRGRHVDDSNLVIFDIACECGWVDEKNHYTSDIAATAAIEEHLFQAAKAIEIEQAANADSHSTPTTLANGELLAAQAAATLANDELFPTEGEPCCSEVDCEDDPCRSGCHPIMEGFSRGAREGFSKGARVAREAFASVKNEQLHDYFEEMSVHVLHVENTDPELLAIEAVRDAFEHIDPKARVRVVAWLLAKYDMQG